MTELTDRIEQALADTREAAGHLELALIGARQGDTVGLSTAAERVVDALASLTDAETITERAWRALTEFDVDWEDDDLP